MLDMLRIGEYVAKVPLMKGGGEAGGFVPILEF
jgi:hypothetical protein